MPSDDLGEVLEVITNLARKAGADGTGAIPARAGRPGKGQLNCQFCP